MSQTSVGAAASVAPRARSLTAAATALSFGTAVVVTTEFIVVGLLPVMARDLEISVGAAGWFVTWFALASALLGPPLTMAASRFEPRRVLAAVLLVFAFANLAVLVAPRYLVVVAVRVVQGAALPVLVSIGSAFIASMAGPGREGRAVSLVYMGVVIAIVVAVPGGVILADASGWPLSFGVLAGLGLLGAGLLGVLLPRDAACRPVSVRAQATVLSQPRVQVHLLLSALLFTAMFATYSYLAAFLETVAGFDGTRVAATLMGFGLAGVLGNWVAGRVVDREPMSATVGVAAILMLAMSAVSLVRGELMLLLPLLAIWGAAHTAAFLLCQVRVMLAAPIAPAFASSLNIAACNLGIAAGAMAGGWVVDHYGIGMIGFGGAAFAAVALATTLVVYWRGVSMRAQRGQAQSG